MVSRSGKLNLGYISFPHAIVLYAERTHIQSEQSVEGIYRQPLQAANHTLFLLLLVRNCQKYPQSHSTNHLRQFPCWGHEATIAGIAEHIVRQRPWTVVLSRIILGGHITVCFQ